MLICSLCNGHYLGFKVLATLLDRSENYLRQSQLNPLVEQGRLRSPQCSLIKPCDPGWFFLTWLQTGVEDVAAAVFLLWPKRLLREGGQATDYFAIFNTGMFCWFLQRALILAAVRQASLQ